MPRNIFDMENISKQNLDEKTKENAEELIKKYKNFSQDELMAELIKTASEEKRNGSLTKEKLDNIKVTLAPYLTAGQMEYLERIIAKLDV